MIIAIARVIIIIISENANLSAGRVAKTFVCGCGAIKTKRKPDHPKLTLFRQESKT